MIKSKKEPGWFSFILKIVIPLFCITLGISFSVNVFDGTYSTSTPTPVVSKPAPAASARLTTIPTEGLYDGSSVQFDYREAMFEEYEKDTMFVIEGKINQTVSANHVRIATKEQPYLGLIGDIIWAEFLEKPKVLEGDLVKVKGRYRGVQEYKSITGQSITVPRIAVDYYEIIQEKE